MQALPSYAEMLHNSFKSKKDNLAKKSTADVLAKYGSAGEGLVQCTKGTPAVAPHDDRAWQCCCSAVSLLLLLHALWPRCCCIGCAGCSAGVRFEDCSRSLSIINPWVELKLPGGVCARFLGLFQAACGGLH